MSVNNNTTIVPRRVARRQRFDKATLLNVLDAFEVDENAAHQDAPAHFDFEGDGEPLYLDVEGFFDLDDEFEQPSRSLATRLVI